MYRVYFQRRYAASGDGGCDIRSYGIGGYARLAIGYAPMPLRGIGAAVGMFPTRQRGSPSTMFTTPPRGWNICYCFAVDGGCNYPISHGVAG